MAKKKFVNDDYQGAVKIVNLPDPSAAQDAATKNYVDNALLGINNLLYARVRATGNVDISQLNNGDSHDGVTVATGDVILLDQQTTASQDGLYTIGATAGTTVRTTSLPSGDTGKGLAVLVGEGTANGNQLFIQTADNPVINTDGLTFTALAAGVTYTADGSGIELSGSTFSLELDGTSLTKSASGLKWSAANAAGTGLAATGDVLSVNTASGVTTSGDNVVLDTSTAARWNSALGPASAGSSITQAHGFGSKKSVLVQVMIESSGELITDGVDVTVDTTNIVVTFAASQSDRSLYRLVWVG